VKTDLERLKRAVPAEVRSALRALHEGLELRRRLPRLEDHIAEIRPFTMVGDGMLRALARQILTIVDVGVPGSLVECGTWRGGVGFLMAKILRDLGDRRGIFLCDSFEGLPAPEAIDGPAAGRWAKDTTGRFYFENCRADLARAQGDARDLGVLDYVTFVPGWFEESLPGARSSLGAIALLRIDADWHKSVKTCLDQLFDQVSQGGFVVFDDYDTWDGCAIAVHEFLGSRHLSHRLLHDACAYFRKI
jgi:hypothetical protein